MPVTRSRPSPIGVHVSVAGGLPKALERARAVGAEAIQIFLANPRGWALPRFDEAGDRAFGTAVAAAGVSVFVHASYLINLGSASPQTSAKSVAALAFCLRRAASVGARGVVVHSGSSVNQDLDTALERARFALARALEDTDVPVLIEPTAGGGGALAHDAPSLFRLLDVLGRDDRIGVCLDTCHMHAAGHDLASRDGFDVALRAYEDAAGRGRIRLVHANDSRDPVGSRRDRHATIGAGTIGRDPFTVLFTARATRSAAIVSESAEAEHLAELATLRALRG